MWSSSNKGDPFPGKGNTVGPYLESARTRVKARPLEGTVSITRTASRGAGVFFNAEVDSCSLDVGVKREVGEIRNKRLHVEAPQARGSYRGRRSLPRRPLPAAPGVGARAEPEPPPRSIPRPPVPASSRLDRAGLGRARRARALSPAEAEQARHKLPGAAPASRPPVHPPARPPSAMPAAAPARLRTHPVSRPCRRPRTSLYL